jgi:uncharacterized Zn-binding protein involved in type VI secretion
MPMAHRNHDPRVCGASTVVQNQSTVFVNGQLWAVKGTENSHGAGGLINTSGDSVFIEGKPVIVHGPDHASPDRLCPGPKHCDPMTATGSPNVFAYGG